MDNDILDIWVKRPGARDLAQDLQDARDDLAAAVRDTEAEAEKTVKAEDAKAEALEALEAARSLMEDVKEALGLEYGRLAALLDPDAPDLGALIRLHASLVRAVTEEPKHARALKQMGVTL